MAFAAKADVVDDDTFSDAGDDILQDAAAGLVKQHIVGGDGGDAEPGGKNTEVVKAQVIARPPAQGQREMGVVAEDLFYPAQLRSSEVVGLAWHEDGDHAEPAEPAIDVKTLHAKIVDRRRSSTPAESG